MGVLRGLTLALIAILPAFILGFIAYLLTGGGTSDTTEWETWMYLPCYGVPLFCLVVAFIFGMKSGRVEDQ